ncbi:autotransporter-associated beta strand repeat-containing protein [Caulobacter sp. LjRoot300]|uniref:autotransporter-associated beta strand repeat-containing protein n=1 Tax=Caulobacter sp. LjRoot300 TaxID=3342321 RepID=UPI003ED017D7
MTLFAYKILEGRQVDLVIARDARAEGFSLARSTGRCRSRVGLAPGRLLCGVSLSALVLCGLPFVAHSQSLDRYWDANGTVTGSGGNGNWNTTDQVWSESNSDVLGPYRIWNNAALDNAIFGIPSGTVVGTVTLAEPITVHNMIFQSVNNWVLSGNTLTLAGATPTVNTIGHTTINSIVAGTAGLNKIGGAQLYLTGTNTFSGGITLGGGTLRVDDNAALGDAGNVVTVAVGSNLIIETGNASSRTVSINSGVTLNVYNSTGTALLTGAGNVNVAAGSNLTNDTNSYTGTTRFNGCNGVCVSRFSSIADLGVASALGAPTTVANGTIVWGQSSQYEDYLLYTGDGDSSNRNWNLVAGSGGFIRNDGTGTLTLTGDVTASGTVFYQANTADFDVLGVLSGSAGYVFSGGATADVTVGSANTYTGATAISGGLVNVPVLADRGVVSSFGTASGVSGTSAAIGLLNGGILSYTGVGALSDRNWSSDGITQLRNDGSGGLGLSGNLAFTAGGVDLLTFGGNYAGTNTFAGVISGAGNLGMNGAGTWVLSGANTRSGTLTVTAGALQAGSASAFGTVTGTTVNGGTLNLDGFDLTTPTLNGSGGTVALGTADLTVSSTANSSYAGGISGAGGLNKAGAGILTLTGASTYSGATNVGGGTLRLDFSGAGGPTDNILSGASTLNMAGGIVNVVGAAGETNTQTFSGLNIAAGANTIDADAGTGGSITVNLGAINRTGGLVNFNLPTSGNITTTNLALGGWATVNATDYAKVVGGNILAFTDADYTDQDDASLWASGQYISDSDGDADSYFGTVGSSVQLAGLQFTTPDATTTVTVASGQTLGVDGTIIVAPSVLNNNQAITGGNLTGASGGGGLVGIQQNGGGALTINSTIVDNAGAVGFTKGGAGAVSLTGANSYTGATTLSAGRLTINSVANGGGASAIGAATAASSNLVLEGGTLSYTGGTSTTDRGFTLVNGGAGAPVIEVTNAAANLTFGGQVVSSDDAGLIKTGAGTLTLADGSNNYVGVTTISGGTLAVDDLANGGVASGIGAATAASSNLVLQTNGELEYTGGTTSTNRGFTLASGQGRIDVAQAATTLTMSGVATGAGTLVKNGAGTLILSGSSNYTGGTVVNAGTLRAGSLNAFGANTNLLTVNAGGAADLTALNMTVGAIAGAGAVDLGTRTLTLNGNNGTFTGTITGAGGLIKGASGQQTINGCTNSYTGVTDIRGALFVDCLANGGLASGIGASSAASSNLVIRDSGTLVYTGGTIATDRGFSLLSGAGYVQVNNAATELTFSGVVTGPGTLVKRGAGILTLTGANNYTGPTQVEGGILRAGSATAFGTGANRALSMFNVAGAAADFNNFNMSMGYLTGGGPAGGNILLGSGTLTLTNPGGSATFRGAISGTGSIVLNSTLTQQLDTCNNSYSGSTTITGGGVLVVSCLVNGGVNSAIGSSSAAASNLTLNNGTLAYVGSGGSTNREFTMGGNAQLDSSGTGTIAFTSTAAITQAGTGNRTFTLGGANTGDNLFSGQIDNPAGGGATSLAKVDGGAWRLSNPNSTYTGATTISGGVLSVDHLNNGGLASSIGASGAGAANLIIGTGGTLRYTGVGDTTDRQFQLGASTTFIESSGTGAVNFTNNAAITYTGSGVRVFALGGTNTGDNVMGASIGNQSAVNITSLAKNDAGKWILTGTNTYTGVTNVNAGTLIVGNGGAVGSIASGTVNNAGVFGFNRSNSYTYAGVIQGIGSLRQLGAGATVLTGASTYTGGTTISAGTLQLGNGGSDGSIVGNVVNNGTLAFNRSDAYIFGGTISGAGRVTQIGAGTTVLTGTNSFTGGASITAGTLQVSSDANLGAASGGLTFNGGTLNTTASFTSGRATNLTGAGIFSTDPGTTLTLTGAVSGAGALTKNGAGTLTLAANNSYTGLTRINAGTLQIGNGGATGSIVGNVLNNGALVFDRAGTLTMGGTIIGGGSVTQAGPGTTILTGANTYAGPTNVDAGTLLVNGDQSGAVNLTAVASGATLGGTGTIGGDVTVTDGGTLAAGSGGVGVLTINGNLALGSTSQLAFELGQANVAGGPLNDLVNVGGNLTLDGTINVTVPAGGSFGPGIYRVASYSGTLADNGLAIGTMPPGSDVFVQTSVANQVNLANTAGLTLNFWDGTGQPKNDGTIQGGDGVWRIGGGTNDWTDVGAIVNADYAQDSFAIFQGTGGTVTVDNGAGNVLAAGMQFAADGYTIAGGPLTLTGAQALVRVGDGTPGDAGLTTTIDAVLTGSAQIVKDLGGTLVLTGANSYTGGTSINGGTLRISSDANLGDAAGALSLNSGTLNTTASITSARAIDLAGAGAFLTDTGTALTLSGVVSGAGALTKDGAGSLLLTNANTYAGGATISAGTLAIGDGGTSGSITGDVANNGTLAFNRSDNSTFAGIVSGTGALNQAGTGTTILTAENSYTGGTTVSAGVLQLGAGGTTGGITGNVVNNAALVFNRSDAVTFADLISSSGRVEQAGSGTTILTGSNSYAGATTVTSGTLLVNGDQSAATGATNVASGATLGGIGIIGGGVTLAGGATLAPSDAAGPGTLTINGNLALAGGATLNYDFGQANVAGGAFNDLVNVGGDLVLAGTLNVATSAGGSFDPGIYRVINYAGALTDNGLTIGSIPTGTDFFVQTSVASQVNLINTNGLALRFWDGAAGGRNDGIITGGDGVWQNTSGNDNWTLDDASINAPFLDSAFAIFGGTAGTITVDRGLGAINVAGIQFATDGYAIEGDALDLVGPQAVIRVGDGSADGLGYTTTIDSVLAGTAQLVKTDLGTLVLTGANSYTGGTAINGGALRISSDANLGDAVGALSLNGGTLNTTADIGSNRAVSLLGTGTLLTDASTTLTLNGTVAGAGGFTKTGAGSLILTGANSFAGNVDVTAGSLFVNGDQSAATGAMSIASGATFGGSGTIGGNVTLADGATLAAGNNNVGTLTVGGNLALGAGTVLAYEFGQANFAGGALNDLVNVGGDLTLDGTINVTASAGGSFGPGIYRVFNYGGALSDNGLALGTLPGGSAVSVQTAIAGQVNLVNTAGLTLSFWDGNAGPKNDGAVNGGDGVWRAGGGSNNWTELTGAVNADYAQDSFAIFSGAPGTVSVDNVGGNVLASGMQFASDGYRITGGPLTLTGAQAIVQVGDGSVAGAGYTATIDAELTGAAGLVKTDAGTLVLAGVNSYAGGTAINGGTLRISADANLGETAGGLSLDGGTLNTTADINSTRAVNLTGAGRFLTDAGATLTLGGTISGPGALTKDGVGSLVLTAANSYGGGATISAGTLQLGSGGVTGSILGDVANNGTLAFNRSDSLTFAGAITGAGAVNQIGVGATILTADNSYTGGTTISAGVLQLGAGGATGGIAGDVVNNAALLFNRSGTVTFAGLISGAGRIEQASGGVTILTAANSYAGATTVGGGTLLVNGDQSAATGLTSVASGATLGGIGTIGGDVTVSNGATLTPGFGGPGTLTINGNLALSSGSSLAVDFGAANAVGSPLNDFVNVGGDLTLDGTINVTVTPGGAFDIGLYRIANYAGALTDNGLAIGTMPAGGEVFVQTSVANQINLINTGSASLNFWDGFAGPKFNGAVDGGDGVWQNGVGNDNWADVTGAVNAPFDNGAFAIFTGAAGTVTIDDGLGAVTASGLQFATNGYTIAGQPLTLTGSQSVIRVGDGTVGGLDYTAVISAELTGATQLVKTDLGTLVLGGSNSYTGGTLINGGTLRISSDANLGGPASGLSINGGALNTTADLSSTRAVDLAGAGAFLTDAGTTLTLSGAISGAGVLTKGGTGTLALSGVGGYRGGTTVGAGTLLVNGDHSGATGTTSVASDASLGGIGTIGGDVVLADGAVLTPGAGGAGTLTVNGNMSLSSGARLNYEFGAANAVGGALNDLVTIGGNLTLDGTITVSVPTGGAFDVGIYRVFNYGGALTDNGLTLGTLPGGSDVAVQTSIAGQVNLVNSAGLTLNFWDGAAGPKNNGVINGGNGVWQNSSGNDNWTNLNGVVNAAYTDAALAVFGGSAGAVTVDGGLGEVTAAGMQFATSGYTIVGDGVTLVGPQSTIRVGDGSAAGAGFTATISTVLSGDTQLVKTDTGTLVLTGVNRYTGGTRIGGGTVQIGADANLGAAAGGVTFDGGTLRTTADVTSHRAVALTGQGTLLADAGATLTLGGIVSGAGALNKAGEGTVVLTADSGGYTGAADIKAGTMAVNGVLGGTLSIGQAGRLEGTGRVGATANGGTIAPGFAGNIGVLTIQGDYAGNNGRLEIAAALGGDSSIASRLVVNGATSGTTQVNVTNRGGLGGQTVEGIKIVDVTGASEGRFVLDGDYVFNGDQAVIAGAYGYRLQQGGASSPADGDWYLRSALLNPTAPNEPPLPLYQPGVPIYEAYGANLQALNGLPTLQQRVGNRSWAVGASPEGGGAWGRLEATRNRANAAISTSLADQDIDSWKIQFGADQTLAETDKGERLVGGLTAYYGQADSDVRSTFGNGSIKTNGYGVGATLIWYGLKGFYVDGQVQFSWHDSDLNSAVLGELARNNEGRGEALSLEVGKRIPLGAKLSVTPQIQTAYSDVRFDPFIDPAGATVTPDRGDSLKTRWGVSLDRQNAWGGGRSHVYGLINLNYEWLDGTRVRVSGTPLDYATERLSGELGVGGSVGWRNGVALYGEVSGNSPLKNLGDGYMLKASVGVRVAF